MTSEDSNRLDDAEFEAFLQGEGELARQLQRLPQPSPSAALDAAILAQAEALAKAEAPVQQAANDASSGKIAKPSQPRFLMRWSTQLAMAACMVLAVLVTLRWQTEPAVQAYDATPQAAPQAEPAVQPAAPIAAPAASVEMEPQAKPELPRPKAAGHKAPPVTKSTPEAKSPAPMNMQDMQVASAYTPAPIPAPPPAPARQNYAGSPSQPASPENSASRVRAIIMPPAPVAAAPAPVAPAPESYYSPPPAPIVAAPAPVYSPAPAPALASGAVATALPTQSELAPVVASSRKTEATPRAEAWLSAIDEMLKAGLRQDALDEWEKFKRAYPDYPVPEKLRAQIRQLQK